MLRLVIDSHTMFNVLSRSFLLVLALLAVACGSREPAEDPVAEPAAVFSRSRIALGSPVEITYRFKVVPGARLDQDYHVMAHFLDGDEELMWTDDHLPPTPTSKWQAGQTIEYKRTVFVPVVSYVGSATVNLGLYSPRDQRRLTLSGEDTGQRAYKVATIELLPQTENVFLIFKDGWHAAEVSSENPLVEWQWTRKTATLSFRNPKRDSTFYLHGDNPAGVFPEGQRVDIVLNEQPVETVVIKPRAELIHRTRLTAAQLGTSDIVELRLHVDQTYVPALQPGGNSRDSRELGVRVFHVFVEPSPR
jgi:hypothetical protein